MSWLARSKPRSRPWVRHHLLGPLDQLSQQLIELQPPQPRKHQHLIRWSADPSTPPSRGDAAPGEGRGSGRPLPVYIDRPSAPRGEPAFRAVEHDLLAGVWDDYKPMWPQR